MGLFHNIAFDHNKITLFDSSELLSVLKCAVEIAKRHGSEFQARAFGGLKRIPAYGSPICLG